MSDTDLELLARYTRQHAEDAFAEIVRRHLGLVYSAALRQVRSPQLAEEVTQSVFIDLARTAAKLKPDTILTTWLYQVTRRTAIDVVRREASRQLREQIATEMNALNATAADWTHIEPLLDEAMHALDDTDRAAVLLRYFENKSLREVGTTLGTSENAAQKRLARAVECLREFFAKRGVTVGASGLVVVISTNAVQAAPVGLFLTISTAAALGGTTIAAITTATATKAIVMTITQKVLITTVLAAAVGTGIYEVRQVSILRSEMQILQQQQSQLAAQNEQLTRERDAALRQATVPRAPNERLNANNTELIKLRAEVTRLRIEAANLPKAETIQVNADPLAQEALEKQNASLLKSYFDLNLGVKIPEAQFTGGFAESLAALATKVAGFTNTTPKTQEDYRRAAAEFRSLTEGRFAQEMLVTAAKKYREANNKEFPTSVSELQPYFAKSEDDSVLKSILDRYEIQPSSRFPNTPSKMSTEWVITQKVLVDEEFDRRIYVGPDGFMQDLSHPRTQP
ncbi:MAG TPA: sigma-70 family RNA polymerase sigma factor [Candidatus Acidoferrum sp.]|nr:sigma-70 family RNA polymerase sigma factor [Candidatus Acidoferrum sp.]